MSTERGRNLPRGRVHSPQAHPDTQLTEDGRPMREVLSYARRGSRFTPRQRRAWDAHVQRYVVTAETVVETVAELVASPRPLVVEIGSGIGETCTRYAVDHPEADVLAFEVWLPGVAEGLHRAGELSEDGPALDNIRFCTVDAAWAIRELVPEGALAELWTFFPDPWQKARHHKRRLVNQPFVHTAASRLAEGGLWRLATDWPDYAEHIEEVMSAEPLLTGGVADRWVERPFTKFERRGMREGRPATDFLYRKA